MAKFKGFNNQQTYQLLTELGYDGPARKEQMDAFVAATPSAGSMLGRYTEIAKQRVEGEPLSGIGMSNGGPVNPNVEAAKEAGAPVMKDFGSGDQDDMAMIYFPDGSMANVQKGYAEAYLNHAKNTGATINSRDDYNNFTLDISKKSTDPYSVEAAVSKQGNDLTLGYRDSKKGKTIDQLNEEATQYNAANVLLKPTGTVSAAPLPADFDAQISAIKAAQASGDISQAQGLLNDLKGQANIPAPVLVEAEAAVEGTTTTDETTTDADTTTTIDDDTTAALGATDTTTTTTLGGQSASDNVGKILIEKHSYKKGSDGLYYAPGRSFPEGITDSAAATAPADTPTDAVEDDAVIEMPSPELISPDPDVTPVSDSEVILPGTPSTPTAVSPDLDNAQAAYADAQKSLTDAQIALSKIEKPEAPDFSSIDYGDINPNVKGFGDLINSGDIPEDMTDYEVSGEAKAWVFTFPNGQKLTVNTPKEADARTIINGSTNAAINKLKQDPLYVKYEEDLAPYKAAEQVVKDAEADVTSTNMELRAAEQRLKATGVPSVTESLAKTISSPLDVVTRPDVYGIAIQDNQLVDSESGQLLSIDDVITKQATLAGKIDSPSVKVAMAYLTGLSPEEKASKYPPAPSNLTEEQLADYLTRQQAQIEVDAQKDVAATYDAVVSQADVKTALEAFAAKTGTPSEDAVAKAATMSPEELAQLDLDPKTLDTIRQIPDLKRQLEQGEQPTAEIFSSYTQAKDQLITDPVKEVEAAKFASDTPIATTPTDYTLTPTQIAEAEATAIEAAAQFDEIASAPEKTTEFEPDVTAEQSSVVSANEIVDVNEILNTEEIVVTAQTLNTLNEAATGKAQTATFTQQLEAQAAQGTVSPQSTVTFQLEKLMDSFNDGTPAWAAGAFRRVNEVMNARGLGASSMASAAMIQAAMESAVPIAQADASIFQAMDMENVRNKQAVALANAAAAQRFELQNLDNRQAIAVQNSMNNANLQLTNLSNQQEAVLAQAQIKAGLQGQTLSVSQNVAMANAARYAEVNNINLTNRQQSSILQSSQALEVDLVNLSNSQQTALANLQVKASMMGQDLTNEQQVAVIASTQAFETEMQNATSKQQAFIQDAVSRAAMDGRVLDNRQQTSLFNVSNELARREQELNNEQQIRMFNMTNKLNIDVENLSNRQQTALANAQIEASMKGQELTNKQQVNIVRSERIAEIANINFSADQARVMRDSELAQTVDLANLNNRQAKLMADAVALTQVDVANLSNEQQAAQQKASAFLQMDMSTLDNAQQTEIFKAQSTVQSIFTDQAVQNSALQFNASSENQTRQFMMNQDAQVDMFLNTQENSMNQFNAGEENAILKFNQELQNQRDMFNAQNQLVVAQANTQWRQDIATINNAAINDANMREAMAANNLTAQGIAELWQQERDLMNYAWQTANNELDRLNQLSLKNIEADASSSSGLAGAAGSFLGSIINGMASTGTGFFSGAKFTPSGTKL